MHMAGSILPSEGHDTLHPVAFAGGVLQVERLMERETYALTWQIDGGKFYIAAHPNGHSCKCLADRMAKESTFRALGQREYIKACGGKVASISVFERVYNGEALRHQAESDLFRELPQ